jgi:membrane protein DedA with SNARE-associated domain
MGIVQAIADWTKETVGQHGLSAVFVLMVLESMCIPIPSEVTMMFAGFLAHEGKMGFWEAVIVGSVANLVGSWIAWGAGYYGVDRWLVRSPRARHHLDIATRWFERYGTPVVFFSRMLPVIRSFISLPAGIARMPLGRFSVLTLAGCIPWNAALVAAGWWAGSKWEDYQSKLHYLDYPVILAILAGAAWWLLRMRRRRDALG